MGFKEEWKFYEKSLRSFSDGEIYKETVKEVGEELFESGKLDAILNLPDCQTCDHWWNMDISVTKRGLCENNKVVYFGEEHIKIQVKNDFGCKYHSKLE